MNLAELFEGDELAQTLTLLRRSGQRHPDHGAWEETHFSVNVKAIVYPAGQDDLLMLPEGERYLPAIRILSLDPLSEGDIALHQNQHWRLSRLSNFAHYGYYDATAIRDAGPAQPHSRGFVVT